MRSVFRFLKYRELLRNLVFREMKLTYCASFLGLLWAMLVPLANMLIFWVVFGFIFQNQMKNFAIYLITGILPWNLFYSSAVGSTSAVAANGNLIKKIYFPRLILPFSTVCYQLVLFSMAFVVFLAIYYLVLKSFSAVIFLYPLAVLLLIVFTSGVAFAVSSVTVFFRDIKQIIEICLAAGFWMTPIVYDFEGLSGSMKAIVRLNPFAPYVVLMQQILYYTRVPPLHIWASCAAIAVVSLLLGVMCFRLLEGRFVDEL
jgi:lipopolysaccharide transport system permease protein